MVAWASEGEVSIIILCLPCSPRYTAVRTKNCSKSRSVITVATMKNTMMLRAPVIVWDWSIHCPSSSAMFDLLHSSTNQEMFEKHLCRKVATMKNTDDFSLHTKEAIMCNHQIKRFSLSAKMNGTQRRTLVSHWRMHCTYCGVPKGTSQAEATSNSEKIKPIALAVIELR